VAAATSVSSSPAAAREVEAEDSPLLTSSLEEEPCIASVTNGFIHENGTSAADNQSAAREARAQAILDLPRQETSCLAGLRPCLDWLQLPLRRRHRPPLLEEPPVFEPVEEEAAVPAVDSGAYVREAQSQQAYDESRSVYERHVAESVWRPTLCLYDASPDPPAETGEERRKMRRAYHMPLNALKESRIDNANFEGSFLFIHRDAEEGDVEGDNLTSPYQWHFAGKSRRWEARVQGRFRQKPTGTLYTGCVLEDFDYSVHNSWAASMLAAAVVPLMEAVVGERFYFSWGTRGEAAETPDGELGSIVTCLAGVDQVIVCPAGETPAPLHTDISGLGLCRNAMSSRDYHTAVQTVADNINTEDTYTFCVWGCSKYIDVLRSSFIGIMGMGSFSYASFLDEWPAHFILYSLDEDESDPRHLERRKKYFVDVMVWGSGQDMPSMPWRYRFLDQRKSH